MRFIEQDVKVPPLFRQIGKFFYLMSDRFIEDSCRSTAAALTFQTLFAVVPLLTVMYTIFNAFEAFDGLSGTVQEFIFTNVVPENVAVVREYLDEFSTSATNLGVPSGILVSVTALLMLFTIERTFNDIWRVKEPRHGFQRFLVYWAILTLGPAVLAITAYTLTLPLISDVTEIAGLIQYLPVLLSVSMFTLLYMAVPNCTVSFKHALIGGVAVSIIFLLARSLFGLFMANSNFKLIYGTFAALPLFLLWIYISWTIVLLGAELVKGLGIFRSEGDAKLEAPLFQLMIILEIFYHAHQQGHTVKDKEIQRHGARIDLEHWNDYKERLTELDLIRAVDRGGMVLSKDLSELTVWDLYRALPWPLPIEMKGESDWGLDLSNRFDELSEHTRERLSDNLETLFTRKLS